MFIIYIAYGLDVSSFHLIYKLISHTILPVYVIIGPEDNYMNLYLK